MVVCTLSTVEVFPRNLVFHVVSGGRGVQGLERGALGVGRRATVVGKGSMGVLFGTKLVVEGSSWEIVLDESSGGTTENIAEEDFDGFTERVLNEGPNVVPVGLSGGDCEKTGPSESPRELDNGELVAVVPGSLELRVVISRSVPRNRSIGLRRVGAWVGVERL